MTERYWTSNRRLAVLKFLTETEKNIGQFEHMDAVILEPDVSAADRWRIEAGIQLSRDERHDYSPINQLLKIKEGSVLFREDTNPAKAISDTLYGVSESEVRRDLEKIAYIDMYLGAIGMPNAYNQVSGLTERLEEVTNILNDAKKLEYGPDEMRQLKNSLWCIVKYQAMDNWQLRYVRNAIGASGRGRSARFKNPEAMKDLISIDVPDNELRSALKAKGNKGSVAEKTKQNADEFVATMQAAELTDQPMRLATTAATNLNQLVKTLGKHHELDRGQLKDLESKVREISFAASECLKLMLGKK